MTKTEFHAIRHPTVRAAPLPSASKPISGAPKATPAGLHVPRGADNLDHMQQRLRRNASLVATDPTEGGPGLDECNLAPETRNAARDSNIDRAAAGHGASRVGAAICCL